MVGRVPDPPSSEPDESVGAQRRPKETVSRESKLWSGEPWGYGSEGRELRSSGQGLNRRFQEGGDLWTRAGPATLH
jgi:hypothetical protein